MVNKITGIYLMVRILEGKLTIFQSGFEWHKHNCQERQIKGTISVFQFPSPL
jgi:G:T-mismatch repair DNA endonuclease (very short patch repair protein)